MAGTIEGFLTGSGLSAAVRVTVGASVWVAFVGYGLATIFGKSLEHSA